MIPSLGFADLLVLNFTSPAAVKNAALSFRLHYDAIFTLHAFLALDIDFLAPSTEKPTQTRKF
jgi:hypothetical protein